MTNHDPPATAMTRPDSVALRSQTPRLLISWLTVGIPLAYGVFQTIKSVLPLLGG